MQLIFWYVLFCINGVNRALGNAYCTVYTFVWIDGEEVWTYMKAVYRTYIDTVCITAENARFCYNESHKKSYLQIIEK